MRERARSRALEIDVRCPAGIGFIKADERRLKQALFNLLSNAIKFTPPGGVIRLDAQRSRDELLLSVCERTTGISPDPSAVAPDGARRRNLTAAGFGLSLVKSLVELHGGRVEIEAGPDRATVVSCRLPLDRGEREDFGAMGGHREPTDSPGQLAAA
jgi:signal transduction histidine kinase